ncbi:hypothetical protein PV11_07869 [Exophiala sideris]|uniref:BTB domain-containing protein n=1 Tax=Exophiala sideris TaxID=1016849 RepID=A0A0D1Z067_9EURO|nr:hypothetical protein PV11_07869 [Exophiala sideris]
MHRASTFTRSRPVNLLPPRPSCRRARHAKCLQVSVACQAVVKRTELKFTSLGSLLVAQFHHAGLCPVRASRPLKFARVFMTNAPPSPTLNIEYIAIRYRTDTNMAEVLSGCKGDSTTESFTASPIITVIVGEERKTYKLHQSLLVKRSPFFAACINAGMKESQSAEVVLPEDSCLGFAIVADWIYLEKTHGIPDHSHVEPTIRAYVMADKYCMPELQNALLDDLAAHWKGRWLAPNRVALIAELTNEDCPLYKLMVAQLAYDFVHHPCCYLRPSEIRDVAEDSDALDFSVLGWPEAFDKLIALRGLRAKLLLRMTKVKKGGPKPTALYRQYYVAVESKSDKEGDKRKADKGTLDAAPRTKRPRVLLG